MSNLGKLRKEARNSSKFNDSFLSNCQDFDTSFSVKKVRSSLEPKISSPILKPLRMKNEPRDSYLGFIDNIKDFREDIKYQTRISGEDKLQNRVVSELSKINFVTKKLQKKFSVIKGK